LAKNNSRVFWQWLITRIHFYQSGSYTQETTELFNIIINGSISFVAIRFFRFFIFNEEISDCWYLVHTRVGLHIIYIVVLTERHSQSCSSTLYAFFQSNKRVNFGFA